MDPWGNFGGWNSNQPPPPPPPPPPPEANAEQQQQALDNLQRLLLAQQQQAHLLQNYNDSQGSAFYQNEAFDNCNDNEPIAFELPYQVVSQNANNHFQEQPNLQGRQLHHQYHHHHPQQQPFSSLGPSCEEPIDVDNLHVEGIDQQSVVARRFDDAFSNVANGNQMAAASLRMYENSRQQQQMVPPPRRQQDTGNALLDSSIFAQGDGGRHTLNEPTQKRMRMENADATFGASRAFVQHSQYSPLVSSGEPHLPTAQELSAASSFGGSDAKAAPGSSLQRREEGNFETVDDQGEVARNDQSLDIGNETGMNTFIDNIFGEQSRDSFHTTGMDAAAPHHSSGADSDVSAVENVSDQKDGQANASALEINDGIFDDADDGVGIPLDRKLSKGDAPEDASTGPTQAATEKVKTDADPQGNKKKKSKPRPKQPLTKPLLLTSPKETRNAKTLLKGKTDLTLILPENACRFLGSQFWIFTAEQFEHVFDVPPEAHGAAGMKAFRDEIRDAIAVRVVSGEEVDKSPDEAAGSLEPTGVEKLLVVSQETNKTAVLLTEPMKATSVDTKLADKRELNESGGEGFEGILRHDLLKSPNLSGDESMEANLDSAAEIVHPSMPFGTGETNVDSLPLNEATALPVEGETRIVTSDSAAELSGTSRMEGITYPQDEAAAIFPGDEASNVTSDKREIAERILESWMNRLAKWKLDSKAGSLELSPSAFSLQGPLGMILPETVRNFLASISVTTAYGFLSIRFTESSQGMQALFAWRKLCGLEDVKPELIAKHMAGLAVRFEKALSSVPPVDAYSRQWMGTALVCLTAASKEFLIDECKLQRPEDFLDGRTSDFSDKLVKWRESKKKSVLKGSGRVAMISSFKAHVRGCVTAENGTGRVTTDDEIIEKSKELSPADYVVEADSGNKDKPKAKLAKSTKKREEKVPPKPTEKQRQITESLMNSTEFLGKALSPDNAEFLSMHGIHTPEQLVGIDEDDASSLVIEMTKWKIATSGEEVQADTCAGLLSEWQSKVKEEIKRLATVDEAKAKKPPAKLKVAKTGTGPAPKRLRIKPNKSLIDPLHTLSSTALTFLETINITTAEEFISTRTSEIANALVEWREQEKMVPLKGSGCSATVSGWKAAVRKAAESTGDEDDLAAAEATSRKRRPSPLQTASTPPRIKIESISHPNLLHGLSRRTFLVQNSNDRNHVYEFELSVRRPKRGFGVYLTYRGVRRIIPVGDVPEETSSSAQSATDRPSTSFVPVLQDVSVSDKLSNASTETFVSSRPGCGFIEIGQYGAIPLSIERQKKVLSQVEEFLMNGRSNNSLSEVQEGAPLDLNTSNVLVERSPELGIQCFFYAAQPMEKGQVIELRFSSSIVTPSKDSVPKPCLEIVDRVSLAKSFDVLSLVDLLAVIDRMSKIADSNNRDIRAMSQEERQNEDGQQHVTHDLSEEMKLQRVRRRVHWLAMQILRSLEQSRGTASTAEHKLVADRARKLVMMAEDCRSLCAFGKRSGEEFVQAELSHEILCCAVLDNPSVHWLDETSWCGISSEILGKCLRAASAHLMATSFDHVDDNKDQLLKNIDSSVIDAVKNIISKQTQRDLEEFALEIGPELNETSTNSISRDFLLENYERLPRGVVARASQVEAYRNAMELCDAIAYDDSVKTAIYNTFADRPIVVATKVPWSPSSAFTRNIEEVKKGNAQIDTKWYIENHVLSVAQAIASSALKQRIPGTPEAAAEPQTACYSRFAGVARSVLEADPPAKQHLPALEYPVKSFELKFVPAGVADSGDAHAAVPCTLSLFLAVVWPRLKSIYGFSIEVGDDPADITFFPPGHKGQYRRASERQVGRERLERSRKRRKVEQQVRGVGFGEVTKLAKRMFVSATRDDMEPGRAPSVKDALKQFVASVLSELPGDDGDEECRRRMAAIEEAVAQFFDEVVPSMLSEDDSNSKGSADLECAYLMQVMLVLPPLLEQSGLSMRRVEDTMGVIRDLAHFVSSKNEVLFAEPLRVCHEEYEAGYDFHRPFLLPRMQNLMSKPSAAIQDSDTAADSESTGLIREIIQPEDRQELSGFITTVLSQFLPCRATEVDILSRRRKGRSVGYPGLMCRHCAGKGKDGRFFFSSLDSLNTCATATLDHMYKCSYIPDELKKRIAHLKTRHPEERKALKHGAQAAFFSRLWKRLWSAEGIPDAPVVLANHRNGIAAAEEEQAVVANISSLQQFDEAQPPSIEEFKSHTDLLTFLATASPWNEKADIRERVGQYYGCIAFGGGIYDTSAMPKHFNSEWILSQMVPQERLSTKRTFLAG